MAGREFWAFRDVSDDVLEANLSGLLGAGARVEARIVAHLAEVENRRLHLLAGCSSMYDYCHKRLGLSDYEAFTRIATARAARKYPLVFEMFERRELNLTAVCEAREFLTAENHQEVLAEISRKTKMQVRELLARRFPRADVPTSLKKLPSLEPLAPGRYRFTLTLSSEQKEKLELARDLLSHANPGGDLGVVVERALDELISRLEKRRLGQISRGATRGTSTGDRVERGVDDAAPTQATSNREVARPVVESYAMATLPRSSNALPTRRASPTARADDSGQGSSLHVDARRQHITHDARRQHITHDARREVLARSGFRCAFVSETGVRCSARAFLQFHHRHPWACGGSDSAENLSLLCQPHNRLLAERDFGRARINEIIAERNFGRAQIDAAIVEQGVDCAQIDETLAERDVNPCRAGRR